MKLFNFLYQETIDISSDTIHEYIQKLQPIIQEVHNAVRNHTYDTPYASINLPHDAQLREKINQLVQIHKKRNPTMMIIIGIGGSNLGTIAVQQALYGILYNAHDPYLKVYYADTVDTDYIYDLILLLEQELEKDHEVLINVVSKSGTTTETCALYAVFLELVKKARPNAYRDAFVITTDQDSALWNLAKDQGMTLLDIPHNVGGRYSVLSAVGLFPLAMLDISIDALHEGARTAIANSMQQEIKLNHAAMSAVCICEYYRQQFTIHDTFLFAVDLGGIGLWYRQLLAESIGKTKEQTGKKEYLGITPTVSIGSTDLHSLGQLYLGGPYDKFTTFVTVESMKSNVIIPENQASEQLVSHIATKSLLSIMNAIVRGVKTAYLKHKRPYVSIILPEKTAYYIGQLLQCKMLEIIYLGHLLGVDPFNQPQVELYKQETREILADE